MNIVDSLLAKITPALIEELMLVSETHTVTAPCAETAATNLAYLREQLASLQADLAESPFQTPSQPTPQLGHGGEYSHLVLPFPSPAPASAVDQFPSATL